MKPILLHVDYDVPFYGNTPDDTHCAQATLRSIRKYFEPDLEFAWEELDKATGKREGKGTWRMTAIMWMGDAGYEVHDVSTIDYADFAVRGLEYWGEAFGPEMAAWEAVSCDIPAEQQVAAVFAIKADTHKRIPTQDDMRQYLHDGFLVQATVNLRRLNNQEGYVGHAVLVKGYDERGFIIHDPGLPPAPNRYVSNELFEEAWADNVPQAKALTAFKFK